MEIELEDTVYNLDAEKNNKGKDKRQLLKCLYVRYEDEKRVSCRISPEEIIAEMQAVLVTSGEWVGMGEKENK